ncbi:hypothetical protein GFV16_09825 [Bacillus megaterium]|nr:hypothetical protein [Priestia megaterium]
MRTFYYDVFFIILQREGLINTVTFLIPRSSIYHDSTHSMKLFYFKEGFRFACVGGIFYYNALLLLPV